MVGTLSYSMLATRRISVHMMHSLTQGNVVPTKHVTNLAECADSIMLLVIIPNLSKGIEYFAHLSQYDI